MSGHESKRVKTKMKNYDYMFDRVMIRQRAIVIFNLFANLRKQKEISAGDLCVGLYPQIDLIKFIDSIDDPKIEKVELSLRLGFWLEENYTIFWLLTCECVDELLENNKIVWNKNGFLELAS